MNIFPIITKKITHAHALDSAQTSKHQANKKTGQEPTTTDNKPKKQR